MATDIALPTVWWKLDGNYLDSAVGAKHGTAVNSPTLISPGKIGSGAVTLSGTNQYFHNSSLTGFLTGSISLWFRQNGAQSANSRIIELGNGDASRVGLIFLGGNQILMQTKGQVFNSGLQANSLTINIVDATWTHAVLTWDASGMLLYIDGSIASNVPGNFTLSAVNKCFVGAYLGGPSNYGACSEDDIRMYSGSVLTAPEVAALYAYTGVVSTDDGALISPLRSALRSPLQATTNQFPYLNRRMNP